MRDDREEISKAYGDAIYDAWRNGLNSDQVDYGRVSDNYYNTYDAQLASQQEVNHLRSLHNAAKQQQEEEQQQQQEEEYMRQEEEYLREKEDDVELM